MDGTPTSRLNDWLLRSVFDRKVDPGAAVARTDLPAPSPITFTLSAPVKSAIDQAIADHTDIMSKHRLSVLHFEGYGKNAIKRFRTSPDSWTQLVIQLAYYKMTGELAATYESAQTRKYKRGRTETIRSATSEALEWCKAMEDPKRSVSVSLSCALSSSYLTRLHFFLLERHPAGALPKSCECTHQIRIVCL
jgi:carnitine O-acetyltransferase